MLAVEVEMGLFACLLLWMCVFSQEPSSKVVADRYAVFWNRTNARACPPLRALRRAPLPVLGLSFLRVWDCCVGVNRGLGSVSHS
uniref:Uncharacterized protein n=1 Tax=Knipowitschia caucasica TaxID=637954 RepID=A0AAV2MQ86_KNICA